MSEPIKAGDKAIVITGEDGKHSPNRGLTVTVSHLLGEHSVYGRMWHCLHPDLVSFKSGEYLRTGSAALPASWLQKLDPEKLKTEDTKEITA
jgi:hypothetical protein